MSTESELTWEANWWGDCCNTLHEELKQVEVIAGMMGLAPIPGKPGGIAHPPEFDLQGISVLDIGGGPVSLLLKCTNGSGCAVVDPAPYPNWVAARYAAHGVTFRKMRGEEVDLLPFQFAEVWIYNVLQHTDDPRRIIENAKLRAPVLRIFEWVGFSAYTGHPQELTVPGMIEWIGPSAEGTEAVWVNQAGAVGRAFAGTFVHGGPSSEVSVNREPVRFQRGAEQGHPPGA
jgi:hypothetical protein